MLSYLWKSAPVWIGGFIGFLLVAGCHGGGSALNRGPGSGGATSNACPSSASAHPRAEPVEGEPVTATKENGRPGVPAAGRDVAKIAPPSSFVFIRVTPVEGGGSPGATERIGRDGKQSQNHSTNLEVVFHNPRGSPHIQSTPDGGLHISFDSTGRNGETVETVLNELVTVFLQVPAQGNPFRAYGSGESEGLVRVSLTGSAMNCIHALMNHGVETLSFGKHVSLEGKDLFIVGVVSQENEEGKLVTHNVILPRKTVPCCRGMLIVQRSSPDSPREE